MKRLFDVFIWALLWVIVAWWAFVIYQEIAISSSVDDDIVHPLHQKIHTIYVYQKNPFIDGEEYVIMQAGSAVTVAPNTIITNAHVVLDHNNEPTGLYEICQTFDTRVSPECVTHATLQYYDRARDLALLTIPQDVSGFEDPVEFGSGSLDLGATVTVYGYPANGWSTITLTQGKISGYESKKYKIDANIDAGNSGGWAFDEQDRLVGIPSFVMEGYTTLGYMVGMDDVQEFINQQGNITTYETAVSESFVWWMESLFYPSSWTQEYVSVSQEYDLFLAGRDNESRSYMYSTDDGNSMMVVSRLMMYRSLTPEQFATAIGHAYEKNCLTSSRFTDTLGEKDFEVIDCEESQIVPDTRLVTYISLTEPGVIFEIMTQPGFDISELKEIIAQTKVKNGTIIDGGTRRSQGVIAGDIPQWLNITQTLLSDGSFNRLFLMEGGHVGYSSFEVVPNKGFDKLALKEIGQVMSTFEEIEEEYLQIKKTKEGREYIKIQFLLGDMEQDVYVLVTTIPETKNVAVMTFVFDYETPWAASTFEGFIRGLEMQGESPFR